MDDALKAILFQMDLPNVTLSGKYIPIPCTHIVENISCTDKISFARMPEIIS